MVKILLVEDDNSLREIYSTRLAAEGYQIIQAGNGEDGLAQAVAYSPDLIVSDAMMPKISGFEMLDLLKGNEKTRNIKVIMMTALSADGQKIRGEKLGADRYLVKSQVGIEDLVRVVHDVLLGETTSENPAAPQSEQPDQNVQQIAPQLQPAQAGQAQVAPSNQPQSQNQPAPVTPIQQQPQPVQAVSNPSNEN
jgi:DNA-binding response OmpR family regulator